MTFAVEQGAFAWKGGKPLFENISFEVRPGEVTAILGPNGAGKTTLLRCAMGFLKWKAGRSTLDGTDIAALSERERWRRMAYVPQAKSAALSYTVLEMVLLGRGGRIGMLSQPGKRDYEIARQVLDSLGLDGLRERRCDELSGGERQMVLIARALAAEPQVLILDEPESNLDMRRQLVVMETMRSLAAGGMACLFNTHYPAHALQRADRALLLAGDGTGLFGPVREIVTPAHMERAFGVRAIIGEIPTPEGPVRDVIPLRIL